MSSRKTVKGRRVVAANREMARAVRSLSVTAARQQLCPLVKGIGREPGRRVGITVSGDVVAFVVSPAELAELESRAGLGAPGARGSIRGSLQIVGDLDESPSAELERTALDGFARGAPAR